MNSINTSFNLQKMGTRTFYGRIEHEVTVRVVPSDSEDSAFDSDRDEKWRPDNALKQIDKEIIPDTGSN